MRSTREILKQASTIAVVGASPDPLSDAHWMPEQMQQFGWRVIPVNAHADSIFGEHCYARLSDIPDRVDLVDVFDTGEDAAQIVREAIGIGARAVLLESQADHQPATAEARHLAHEAGVDYVEDDCVAMQRTIGCLVCADYCGGVHRQDTKRYAT
jgi:predicted CoA-binding protein